VVTTDATVNSDNSAARWPTRARTRERRTLLRCRSETCANVALSSVLCEQKGGTEGLAGGVNRHHEGVMQEDSVRVVVTAHHLSQHPEVCQVIYMSSYKPLR
jgi:hypothetical protein